MGVAEGVALGVEDALSTPTRDFLVEERGVTLVLRKALTGVTLSLEAVAPGRGVAPVLLRAVRVL